MDNYTPTIWIGGQTIATADKMNNMENGITESHNRLDAVDEQFNTKANDNEVVKKGYGTLNDFDEETRAVLQGLESGNINAVLGDGNVSPLNLNENLKSLCRENIYEIGNCVLGSINSADGNYVTSSVRIRTNNLLYFKTGDTIYTDITNSFYIVEYSSTGAFVGVVNSFVIKYTFTKDMYCKIVIRYADNSSVGDVNVLANKINCTRTNNFNYSNEKIERRIIEELEKTYVKSITTTLNNATLCVLGSIISTDGNITTSSNRARTDLMKFSIGDKIYGDGIKFYCVEYTIDGEFVKLLNSFTSSYIFNDEKYVKIVFSYDDDRDITDVTQLSNLISVVSFNNFNYSNNKINEITSGKFLEGKKWVVVGDSTTDSKVHTSNKYHYWVSQDTGIEVIDFGKSGTGFKRTEEKNTAFYQRVATIPIDADIVTIFGLGNDCSQSYTVGEVTDSTTDTWCGCVNKTIDIILERCPLCNIALVSPYQWGIYPTSTDNKMKELSNKLKEIADYRGFEFLDLYKRSSVRPNDVTFNSTYFYNGDKVHLNEEGHRKFLYPKFKQLVLGLTNKLS